MRDVRPQAPRRTARNCSTRGIASHGQQKRARPLPSRIIWRKISGQKTQHLLPRAQAFLFLSGGVVAGAARPGEAGRQHRVKSAEASPGSGKILAPPQERLRAFQGLHSRAGYLTFPVAVSRAASGAPVGGQGQPPRAPPRPAPAASVRLPGQRRPPALRPLPPRQPLGFGF